MSKKVILDAYRGGEDIGNSNSTIKEKDFNLKVNNYISKRLNELGIENKVTRNKDETIDIDSRINKIKSFYGTGNDVIVISNALTKGETGSEIVYSLRNSSTLPELIANEIQKNGGNVNKYYQRRLPSDTSKDYYQLLRDTNNNESLIVYYGNIDNSNDLNLLENNWENLAEAVVSALAKYIGVSYTKPNNNVVGTNTYTVQKGDTLYGIANKFNTTVDTIKNLNNLTSNNLSVGKVLKLPGTNNNQSSTNTYIVQKGDTLYGIANKFNTTVVALKDLNNLTSNNLSIGTVLKIPTISNNTNTNDYELYTVKSGDSLYSIAKKYNTTVDKIKSLNNLTSNLLTIGKTLKIPTVSNNTSTNNYELYTVKSGDSLYSIAKKYNTTVDKIKSLNNLTSNLLTIGKTLKIPK